MSGKNKLPYYKRYPRDFLEGTLGMPFELKAAYGLVLDLIYIHGTELPDDKRFIAGQLNVSVRKWSSIRSKLIEMGKLQIISGFISNYRAVIELESLSKYQDKQAENGSGSNKNKDLQEPAPKPKSNQPEPEPEPVKKVSKKVDFDLFWRLWPNKVAKPKAKAAWLKLTLLDQEAIISLPSAGFEAWRNTASPNTNPIHPAPFLNNRRWEDAPIPNGGGNVQTKTWAQKQDEFAALSPNAQVKRMLGM